MARIRRFALAAVLAAGIAGCTVGPDYHLPKTAMVNAPTARAGFVGARLHAALVRNAELPQGWWHLYRSADLDRLVAAALAANTDLRVADANLERSRALVDEARAQAEPSIGFGASFSRTQVSAEEYLATYKVPAYSLYDVGFAASYPLDLFGGIRRGIEAARDDDDAVQAARDLVQVSVVAQVTRAYVEICADGDELATARASLALQEQSLALTRQLVAEGRAMRLDSARSESQVDQLRSSLPGLEAARRNALFQLATLTGRPPGEYEASLTACATPPMVTAALPVGDGAALLKRRPDIRRAERELAAATAEIGVATAALYPTVVLNGSIGSAGVAQDFLKGPTNAWSIGPAVQWQLNQSAARARIAQANAAQKAALARFDGAVLAALRDVETAINVYGYDLERLQSLTASRDQAALARQDAVQLQLLGRGSSLATLDAERTEAAAQSALAAQRAKLALDQVALFLALGGGWEKAGGSRG